ncbi:MAG: CDP-alcohol phosphatidyltransferase family protein [Candidatus Aureabacteria bacterium]|nr:CDP-alcohol phosphatidyltransferase family protein [Candidatus Auribacterota bacterium]
MLNLPNIITLIRILLVPCFVALLLRYRETGSDMLLWGALMVFAVAASSDVLDGFVARIRNEKSRLGACLDPLADKLLLVTAVVILSIPLRDLARLPSWFPVIVISRDAVIVLGSLLISMRVGKVTPVPSIAGKFTTFFQILTVIWVLLRWPHHVLPLYAAAILTLVSGVGYVRAGMRQLHVKALSRKL